MNKTPQELADYLRRANIWRRSNIDDPMPEPTELGEAIDQAIAILEKQAQPRTLFFSDCCQAKTEIGGRNSRGATRWYVCTDCRKPCDVYYQDNETTQP